MEQLKKYLKAYVESAETALKFVGGFFLVNSIAHPAPDGVALYFLKAILILGFLGVVRVALEEAGL